MPLDMVLACSNYASWNCGPLAFGLPSASNKLSQPGSSDVPFALKAQNQKSKPERQSARQQERDKKLDQARIRPNRPTLSRSIGNKRTSQTYYYSLPAC